MFVRVRISRLHVSKDGKDAARDERAADRERIKNEQQKAAEKAAKERPKSDK